MTSIIKQTLSNIFNSQDYTVFVKNSIAFPYFGPEYVRNNLISNNGRPCLFKAKNPDQGCQIFKLGDMVEMAGGNYSKWVGIEVNWCFVWKTGCRILFILLNIVLPIRGRTLYFCICIFCLEMKQISETIFFCQSVEKTPCMACNMATQKALKPQKYSFWRKNRSYSHKIDF